MSNRQRRCQRHPDNTAEEKCVICHGKFCRFCTVPNKNRVYHGCPICPNKTVMLPIKVGAGAGSLVSELMGAFGYPIHNKGWVMILLGAITGAIISSIISLGGVMMPLWSLPLMLAILIRVTWRRHHHFTQ